LELHTQPQAILVISYREAYRSSTAAGVGFGGIRKRSTV
jgi:hypothetical protein